MSAGFISSTNLVQILRHPDPSTRIAVVDVRDYDYKGSHIRGSLHFPFCSFEALLPELYKEVADKDIVVFHCMYSQERGPRSAERYLRYRDNVAMKSQYDDTVIPPNEHQKVFILQGGFKSFKTICNADGVDLLDKIR